MEDQVKKLIDESIKGATSELMKSDKDLKTAHKLVNQVTKLIMKSFSEDDISIRESMISINISVICSVVGSMLAGDAIDKDEANTLALGMCDELFNITKSILAKEIKNVIKTFD